MDRAERAGGSREEREKHTASVCALILRLPCISWLPAGVTGRCPHNPQDVQGSGLSSTSHPIKLTSVRPPTDAYDVSGFVLTGSPTGAQLRPETSSVQLSLPVMNTNTEEKVTTVFATNNLSRGKDLPARESSIPFSLARRLGWQQARSRMGTLSASVPRPRAPAGLLGQGKPHTSQANALLGHGDSRSAF